METEQKNTSYNRILRFLWGLNEMKDFSYIIHNFRSQYFISSFHILIELISYMENFLKLQILLKSDIIIIVES